MAAKTFETLQFDLADGRRCTLQREEILHDDIVNYAIHIDDKSTTSKDTTWTTRAGIDHTVREIMINAENMISRFEAAKITPDPRLAYNQDVYTHLPDDARNWAEGSVYADAIIGQGYRDKCGVKIAANVLNHHFKACVK